MTNAHQVPYPDSLRRPYAISKADVAYGGARVLFGRGEYGVYDLPSGTES